MYKNELLARIQKIDGNFNRQDFIRELKNIFEGMHDIAKGFLKIAHGANQIKEKKYYQELGYQTFDVFCKDAIGLTRKTIYLYLRIEEVINKYPEHFSHEYVTILGSAKMDKILVGIYKIEQSNLKSKEKNALIKDLVQKIEHTLSVGEIESIVSKSTKRLK
jgi:hypothetical protein